MRRRPSHGARFSLTYRAAQSVPGRSPPRTHAARRAPGPPRRRPPAPRPPPAPAPPPPGGRARPPGAGLPPTPGHWHPQWTTGIIVSAPPAHTRRGGGPAGPAAGSRPPAAALAAAPAAPPGARHPSFEALHHAAGRPPSHLAALLLPTGQGRPRQAGRPPVSPRRLHPPRCRPLSRGPAPSPFAALPPAAGCSPSRLAVLLLPTVRGRPHRPAGRRPAPGGCVRRGAGRAPGGLPPPLLGRWPLLPGAYRPV